MKTLICLFFSLWACNEAVALSQPWRTLWNKIRYTVGRDPGVQVDPLDTSAMPYVINIHVQDPVKAQALASVLIPAHTIGNIVVAVRVAGATPTPPTSIGALADALRTAFETNPLFVSAYALDPTIIVPRSTVMTTFSKSVVQFFNDDLSEPYGNFSEPAHSVFREILSDNRIWFGTASFTLANSASFQSALAAPNTILSIMGPEAKCGSGLRVSAEDESAEILYASPTLINFVAPVSVADLDWTRIRLMCRETGAGSWLLLNVVEAAPALFTADQNGVGQASVINEDLRRNAAGAPARRGSVVTMYGTGFGKATPPDADGISRLLLPVSATVGGMAADVQDAMLAPGTTTGVQQIKVKIPADAPTGPSVPIRLQAGDRSTQPATTIAVE